MNVRALSEFTRRSPPSFRRPLLLAAAFACLSGGTALAQPPAIDFSARFSGTNRWMFTAVPITNIERSVEFYRSVLKLVVKSERKPNASFAEIFLGFPDDSPRAPNVCLMWRGADGPALTLHPTSLAFEVADAQAAAAAAKALGGRVVREPRKIPEGPLLVGVVEDPDGNRLELIQYLR